MKKLAYVIVHAQTLAHLQTLVNEGMAEGYVPVGGPFNSTAVTPMCTTVAQAMVLAVAAAPVKPEARKAKLEVAAK